MVNSGLPGTIKCEPAGEPQVQRSLLECGLRQTIGRGAKDRVMKFLVRTAFWLTVVVLLLPSLSSQRTASAPQLSTGEAVSAASAAVSDLRQFCARQPGACVVGSQALTSFGQKAQAGAKMLYDFLTEHFGGPGAAEKPGRTVGKPALNTLAPADLAAPWRGAPARKEADAKRPA